MEVKFIEDSQRSPPYMGDGSLQLNDAADEFFDVQAESEYDQTEKFWPSDEMKQSLVNILILRLANSHFVSEIRGFQQKAENNLTFFVFALI